MSNLEEQLDLFAHQSLNPVYELKQLISTELSRASLSRDQIVDKFNEISTLKGIPGKLTKSTLDSWCKISDQARLPNPVQLMLLCAVLKTNNLFQPLIRPLGSELIGPEEIKVLKYGIAEINKKKAVKEVRKALEDIE